MIEEMPPVEWRCEECGGCGVNPLHWSEAILQLRHQVNDPAKPKGDWLMRELTSAKVTLAAVDKAIRRAEAAPSRRVLSQGIIDVSELRAAMAEAERESWL